MGEPVGAGVQLGVREDAAAVVDGRLVGVRVGLLLEEGGQGGRFDVHRVGVEGGQDLLALLGGEEVGAGERAVRVGGELLDGAAQPGGQACGFLFREGVPAVAQPQDRAAVGSGRGDQGERVVGGVLPGDGLDAQPGELLRIRSALGGAVSTR